MGKEPFSPTANNQEPPKEPVQDNQENSATGGQPAQSAGQPAPTRIDVQSAPENEPVAPQQPNKAQAQDQQPAPVPAVGTSVQPESSATTSGSAASVSPPVAPAAPAGEASSLVSEPASPPQQPVAPTETGVQNAATAASQPNNAADNNQPSAGGAPTMPHPPQPPQQPPAQPSTPAGKTSHKKLLSIGLALLLIIGIVGFVFGYYLPNQPENVYSAGLDRTGDTMYELVLQSTEQEQLEELSRMQLTGSLSLASEDFDFEGDLTVQLDETKSNSNLVINAEDATKDEAYELGASVLTEAADGERFPDMFVQLRGIEQLGLAGMSRYDGQWIEISANYLESNFGEYIDEDELDTDMSFGLEDYGELSRVVSKNVRDYVLTSDADTAILEMNEIIGEEEFDDVRTYHYDVSLNTENAYKFCDALIDDIWATEYVNNYVDNMDEADHEEKITKVKDDCREGFDELAEKSDVEMWMDRSTRLIHKIRFTEAEETKQYLEIGQRYQGGDELELFFNSVDEAEELEVAVTSQTNIATNTTTTIFTVDQGGTNGYTLDMSLELAPYHEEIDVERPADMMTIEEILKEFEQTRSQEMTTRREAVEAEQLELQQESTSDGAEFEQSATRPSQQDRSSSQSFTFDDFLHLF